VDNNSETKIGSDIAPEGATPEWYLVHKTEFHGRSQQELTPEQKEVGQIVRAQFSFLIDAEEARRAKLTPEELAAEAARLEEERAWGIEEFAALEAIQMAAKKAGRYVTEEDIEAGLAPIEAKYAHLIEAEKARDAAAKKE